MTIYNICWERIAGYTDEQFADDIRSAFWFRTREGSNDNSRWTRADIIIADDTDYRANDFPVTYWLYPELTKAAKEWTPWIKIYEDMKIPKEKNKLKKMLKKHPYVYIKI